MGYLRPCLGGNRHCFLFPGADHRSPLGQADLGRLVGLGRTSDLHTRIMADLCGLSDAQGAERAWIYPCQVRRSDRNFRFFRHPPDTLFGAVVAHISPGP